MNVQAGIGVPRRRFSCPVSRWVVTEMSSEVKVCSMIA